MSVIQASIEVDVPVRTAYDQWTQFEEFPRFMEGIEAVHHHDDTHLHWVARIAGVQREWDARVTEQIPDQLVAWTSVDGTRNDGHVTFEPLDDGRTEVALRMDVEPDGVLETVADHLGVIEARVIGDLGRFKEFIERRQRPTGAWRGEVDGGDVVDPHDDGPGEVPASTGGVIDLDRVIGTIPVLLVFVEPLIAPEVDRIVEDLGLHLADFGRRRVQLLVVANVDEFGAEMASDSVAGNVRILADRDASLAERYGVTYRSGAPTTVLIGADGEVAAIWVDRPGPGFVDDLRHRLGALSSS
jgi:peroxiredoxin/carbon monoxide dehydrogenase subunit G